MSTEEKKTLVPRLRFPEFQDAERWLQQKLGSVATFFKGKGLPKSALVLDGKRPCIHYGELFTLYSEVIDFIRSRTNSEEDVFLSVKNDVLMPTSDVTPSGLAKACCLNSDDVILGGDILVIRTDKHSVNGEFLARYIRHLERKVLQLVSGSTVFHLYASSMEKLALSIPSKLAEQQKIADCLSSLDELIAAQGRKVHALKTHKKGLMQQLSPREGETQPRLRFPEFQNTGEWIQKAIGDVAEVLMCKRIFAEETNPSEDVPFYKIGTLGDVPDAFISREKFEDYKSRYNYPRTGEVLITCSGTVGKCLSFDGQDAYFQDSNIVWLDNPTGEVSNEFLLMFLSNVNWGTLNSTTITRIYGPDLRGLVIKYPVDDLEQRRITLCLSSIDTLITAAIQELEALKTHKKGLMQQLFPSVEAVNA
jgi:type I restriction enzyme, S subunit